MTRTCTLCFVFMTATDTEIEEHESLVYLHNHIRVLKAFLILHRTIKSLTSKNEPEIPGRTPHMFSVVIICVSKLFF